MKVNEIFYSIQGEIDVGTPTMFIRLQGCNMIPKCKFCDSSYSWNEGKEMTNQEIYEEIKEYLNFCDYIVFTGGEPTCQIEDIINFKIYLGNQVNKDIYYGLETNGLIYSDMCFIFDKISVSPKKQNYNIETLNRLNDKNTRYKFVYENKNDLWFEKIIEELDLYDWQVYIMPEGKTKEEQEQKMNEVVEYCKEKGYNFAPRIHILIWGQRRAK